MRTNAGKATEYVRAGFLFQIPVSLIVGIVAWIYLPIWLGKYPDAVVEIARWYTVLTLADAARRQFARGADAEHGEVQPL